MVKLAELNLKQVQQLIPKAARCCLSRPQLHKIPGTTQGQALQTCSNNEELSGSNGHQSQR